MFNTLALISVLTVMLTLRTLVSIFPSVLASLIRWKESVNIESSVKLARDRDLSAIIMFLPFCLTVYRFQLYNPTFIAGMTDSGRLWAITGIFTVYILIRYGASKLAQPRRMPQKTYSAAVKSAYTFFILLTLLLMSFSSIAVFSGISSEVIKTISIWLSSLIYGLYLIRKLQIFMSSCSIFTGFLYLCTLEIIPTGILVVTDIVF